MMHTRKLCYKGTIVNNAVVRCSTGYTNVCDDNCYMG